MMQAVTELEKRFKTALKNTDVDAQAGETTKENKQLAEQVKQLETVRTNKDAKIAKLHARITALTEKGVETAKQVADLQKLGAGTVSDISELQASLDMAELVKNAALEEVNELQDKIKEMDAGASDGSGATGGDQEISDLKAKLEALHVQRETDLTEVNVILEKLTPLVEGK